MKALTSALGLLAVLPTVLSAQARVHLSAPVLRVSLGPVTLHAGVGSRGLTVRPTITTRPTVPAARAVGAAGGSALAARVLSTGERYLGTRYVYGGETPEGVGARADRVIAKVRKIEGNVALFAHGHIFRVLAARWINLPGRITASISCSIPRRLTFLAITTILPR